MSQSLITYATLFAAILSTVVDATPILAKRGAAPVPAPTKSGWKTTWVEDFTDKAGIKPKWKNDTGTQYPGGAAQWGTFEVETYSNSSSNLQINNGILSIIPKKKVAADGTITWTSGRIETIQSNFQAAAGKKMLIEGNIKLGSSTADKQQGIWPAFWALGASFRTGGNTGWPAVGEWDILESVNGLGTAWGVVHCGTNPGGPCQEANGLGGATNGVSRGNYHIYGFEVDRTTKNWKTEKVNWYIDGKLVRSVNGTTLNSFAAWDALARKPFFILLDVAVGGAFPNAVAGKPTPNANTADGAGSGMFVDYVAVYNSV